LDSCWFVTYILSTYPERDASSPASARSGAAADEIIVMSRLRSGLIQVLRASVAPFLLLVTPFLGYLQYQQHGLANPEVALFLLLAAALALLLGAGSALSSVFSVATLAGLLTFLFDVQAKGPGLKKLGWLFLGLCALLWVLRRGAHRIVAVMMVTVLLALWLLPQPSRALTMEQVSVTGGAPTQHSDLPLVLHFLLDEFIGVEGLPSDLTPPGFQQALQSFFTARGFRLFGNAYSEYPMTAWSVPQLVNLEPGHYVPGLTVAGPSSGSHRLVRNAYFERLVNMGYAIQVHEPDYMYMCPEGLPASCRTYPTNSLQVLNHLDVPLGFRFSVVGGTFLGQSEAYTRLREKYQTIRLRFARRLTLPAWNWERGTEGAAGSMLMVDGVTAAISRAQRSTFVFAHILLPHYPYVYDANCNQRPVTEWMRRSDPDRADVPNGIINVPEGRATRYRAYFQQVTCTLHQIDRFVEAIPPPLRHDAIIIVHGDHGSRITLVDPTTVAPVSPSASDYADAFSTLFAVRSPSIEAAYDLRRTPITCLLRTLVDSSFRSIAASDACSSPNTVFFMTGGKKPPEPRPLPHFGAASAEPERGSPQ
jgi:hypothetical protein